MLSEAVDIQRVRQYFDLALRAGDVGRAARADLGFVAALRRGLLPTPLDRPRRHADPFPPPRPRRLPGLDGRRVAVLATGGSGALASLVGVARVLQEAGVEPVGFGVCSGSALFGVPLAAGLPPDEVAARVLALRPQDYLDPDWAALLALPWRLGRGWAGLLRGDALEATYRAMIGEVTLGQLPIPVWLPVWNIEGNRLEYLGPDTHPDLSAARAVRMAVALPVAAEPTRLGAGWWLDGGIVEILPAQPFVAADRADVAVVVNCFYPSAFSSPRQPRWREQTFSVLHVASQTRIMQHLHLARRSLADLRAAVPEVVLVEPVGYETVQGGGLYGQFVDTRLWASFMAAGYQAAAGVLAERYSSEPS